MKVMRYAAPVAALFLIVLALNHRGRKLEAPVRATVAAPPAAEKSGTSVKPAAPPTTSTAGVDVYFLPEEGEDRKKRAVPSSMRQPTINGTRKVTAVRAVTSKADGTFISPRWSPDGLELLFSQPGYNGLYKSAADGGEISQLTSREGVGYKARWNDQGEIETRGNDGTVQSFKSDGTPVDAAVFEQDTSLVGAYTKDDTVYYRGAPGEAPRPLTQGDDRYYGGVVSPDGKYIAYNGLHTGLYIEPLDGSGPPVSLGEGYSPAWLPDGSGLVYNISQDDGHNILGSDLYLADRTGETVSKLTETESASEMNPTVSPDGTSVAFESDGVIYVGQLQ